MDAEFWHWWVGALVLALLEAIIPGTFMIWLAAAAAAVGALMLVVDLDWRFQFLAFALLSVIGVVISILFLRSRPSSSEDPGLNRRAQRHIGRTVVLETDIRNGRGRATVGDSVWTVTGEDMPAGTAVRVTGVDGTTLSVQRADAQAPAERTP